MTDHDVAELIEEYHPDFEWDRFKDIRRALRWELYWGPQEEGYWHKVEPLKHYKWKGYMRAEEDLLDFLSDLPYTLYLDEDDQLYETDPCNDDDNWVCDADEDDEDLNEDELVYVGPEYVTEIVVPQVLLGNTTFKEIYA